MSRLRREIRVWEDRTGGDSKYLKSYRDLQNLKFIYDDVRRTLDKEYIIIDPHLEKLLTAKYQNKIKDLESDLDEVKVEYNNFKGMSFWSRVKFLFKGGKYDI